MIEQIENGMPTGHQVRRLMENINLAPDTVITHEQIARVAQVEPGSNRYKTIVTAFRRLAFREHGLQIASERGVGYRVLTASGAVSVAVNDFGRAAKKISRTAVHVAAIDSRQLPNEEKPRLDHVRREIHMAAAAAKATRLALVRLPDTAIRRDPLAISRVESQE